MSSNATELRALAATLDEAKKCLSALSRQEPTKPKHVFVRSASWATKASRCVLEALKLGCSDVMPGGSAILAMPFTKVGMTDANALGCWRTFIAPALRTLSIISNENDGALDHPAFKTDGNGRPLGRDGLPLRYDRETDPVTGAFKRASLISPPALVTDDYDDADVLAHLQHQAAEWAGLCDVAATMIRESSELRVSPTSLDNVSTGTALDASDRSPQLEIASRLPERFSLEPARSGVSVLYGGEVVHTYVRNGGGNELKAMRIVITSQDCEEIDVSAVPQSVRRTARTGINRKLKRLGIKLTTCKLDYLWAFENIDTQARA